MGSSVPILLTLVTVAVGIEPGDVDGSLGYGRNFEPNTVESVANLQYIEDSIECCHECNKINGEVMVSFHQEGAHKNTEYAHQNSQERKECKCFTRKYDYFDRFTGTNKFRPATIADGSFSGFCGNYSVEVDGGIGEGRHFTPASVNYKQPVTLNWDEDQAKCCEICQDGSHMDSGTKTEMFSYLKKRHAFGKTCLCYESIPGKTPVTYVKQYFADICGTNVDPAFSTINKEGCYDMKMDYPGNDINMKPVGSPSYVPDIWVKKSTAASCQYLCSKTIGCEYFTWTMGSKRCYLKTSKSTNSYEAGAISGPKNC